MTGYGARILPEPPKIQGRVPNDYAQELEDFLEMVGRFSDVVNTALETMAVSDGPDGPSVTIDSAGSDHARIFMHMGA